MDTPDGPPYRVMTNVGDRILRMYLRLLVHERSRVATPAVHGTRVPGCSALPPCRALRSVVRRGQLGLLLAPWPAGPVRVKYEMPIARGDRESYPPDASHHVGAWLTALIRPASTK